MKYRFESADSEEFEVDDARVLQERDDKGRLFILRFIAYAATAFLVAAATYDIVLADGEKSDFSSIRSIWSSCQGFIGIVIGYYFGKNK